MESDPVTYPLRMAARLTGLSAERLRAWERRYGVVIPQRTPGGTRRYSAADLRRLRLVKAAVDAGHRISEVAVLQPAELERRARAAPPAQEDGGVVDVALLAIERLDATETQRILSIQLSARGPMHFARSVALPLAREIGDRWGFGTLAISAERLASNCLRNLLGSSLQATTVSALGPRLVFATPVGERHELGLQTAALTALSAGASPIYLGAELPVAELYNAAVRARAEAVVLAIVSLSAAEAERLLRDLRATLPDSVFLWIGGATAGGLAPIAGVEYLETLDQLETRVTLLASAAPRI